MSRSRSKVKPLRVRRRIWKEKGEEKTAIHHRGRWLPCEGLEAARNIAAKHGYAGIKVEII